jgi:hypothetical protein
MQPVDRLGQPLAVGDWVVVDGKPSFDFINGMRLSIQRIAGHEIFFDQIYAETGTQFHTNIKDRLVRKIRPNPETTTWDNCEWQPNLQEKER